jgi:opacity protein-like surface antigen
MKKTKFMLIVFLLITCISEIQAQQAVVSTGGNATGSGGSASYSIGQIDYVTATGTGGTATQGVQQPFEIVTLSGQEFTEISLQMLVYPNPTSSFVNLKIDNFNLENLSYQLIDLNGREILNKKITESETQIQLENYPSAIYLLNVNQANKTIKTFKIIKTN